MGMGTPLPHREERRTDAVTAVRSIDTPVVSGQFISCPLQTKKRGESIPPHVRLYKLNARHDDAALDRPDDVFHLARRTGVIHRPTACGKRRFGTSSDL